MRRVVLWLVVLLAGCVEPALLGVVGPGGGVDAGPGCDESPCRLAPPQCGCGDGLTCQLVESRSRAACVPPGGMGEGERCAEETDCAAGLTCTYLGEQRGICSRLCASNDDCPGSRCHQLRDVTPRVLGGCGLPCDPVNDTGCPADMSCFLLFTVGFEPMGWATTCRAVGTAALGATCDGSTVPCAAGLRCEGGACRQPCILGGAPCAAGACAPLDPPARLSTVEYGVCR